LLMGGYPCQPFSTAGKRGGADDPRHLWPFIEFGIAAARPFSCFFENVSGHLPLGFEQVLHSLRSMGYAVEAGIFTAEEVGAPHKRARLFILAILADAAGFPKRKQNDFANTQSRSREAWALSSFRSSEELAHTVSYGAGTDAGGAGRESEADEGEIQREERDGVQRQRSGGYAGNCGSAGSSGTQRNELDNTSDIRQSKQRDDGKQIESSDPRFIMSGSNDQWPARPGAWQFDWEAPRVIESGVGCSIDGYNFREDLLRALGNGVVEQTAELAFRTLLKKHFA